MHRQYNVVLVGCGHMGAAHLDDIYYREDINIEGVVDLNPEKAKLFVRKYGARSWSTNYQNYLKDENVDIVIIATYPSSHLKILKDCIAAGKHVLCEKPITTNLKEAQEFVKLVKNAKSKVLVGHILRHNTTYQTVAKMIQEGAIGSPIIMRMSQNHHTMDWNKYLALIKETSPIIDCGVHYIDIMRWFTGAEVVSVSGVGLRTEADVPEGKYNYGLITLTLSDGSIGYYEAGWGNTIAADNLKEFVGPKGRIRLVYQKDRILHQEEGDLIEYYKYPEKTYEIINVKSNRKPTYRQLKCLIDMIEKDTPASPTIDDVYTAFEIAVMADEKIKKEHAKIEQIKCV